MFKKLKEKIAVEVNSTRLQEIISSAQAAVNLSGDSNSTSSNFFSLSNDENDENTPQNSPLNSQSVDLYSPSTQNTSSSSFNNGIRPRKLSNSSVASDVFRLPAYDLESPIYHLQSDWESASEAEDSSTVGAQLDVINKEQIYQAYRNSLDKYQKYRKKFSDLAIRYKTLEQDNAKARSVLVETQDKALRRISELREQCVLSAEAKAHLESNLRLEIDEKDIVINTLQTKMKLLGEKCSEKVLNLHEQSSTLLNLSDDISTSNEQNDQIVYLEKELKELRKKLANESTKSQENEKSLHERQETIAAENTTLLSELTSVKEKCVKQTHDLEILEDRLKQVFEEKRAVNFELNSMKDTVEKVSAKFKILSEEKVKLLSMNEQLQIDLKTKIDELQDLKQEINNTKLVKQSSDELARLQSKRDESTRDLNKIIDEKSAQIALLSSSNSQNDAKLAELEKQIALCTLDKDSSRAKIESLKKQGQDYEKTLEREIREKNEFKIQVTNIIQEIGRLEEQLKEVKLSHSGIQSEKQKLEEKIGRIQRQHDEAKKQDKDQAQKWQAMIKDYESKLHDVQSENTQLSEQNCLLQEDSRRNADELKKIQLSLDDVREVSSVLVLEDRIKTLSEQLTQCTGDHASLFDAKEQLEHQYRSLQDENETKEKEKMCLIDDLHLAKSKLTQLESENLKLTECCDNLGVVVENIKIENDAMIKTRDELQKSCENITSEFNKINLIKQRCEQEMETLKKENKSLKKSLIDVENLLKQTHDEKQSLTESLHRNATDIEKKMENERVMIQASDEKIQELTRLISEKEMEVKNLEIINSSLKETQSAVSTTNSDLEQLNKDLLAKITVLQRECQKMKDDNVALATQRNEVALKIEKIEETTTAKILEMSTQFEKLTVEKNCLEKEIESNRIVIKDLNSDYETLNEEKAALVAKMESVSEIDMGTKLTTKHERYETDNEKLQEVNRELLVKLENLEKSSERKISDLSQEIENLTENVKHYGHVNAEYNELKNNFELLKSKHVSKEENNISFNSMKAEKDELENRLKKIMDEVNEVSSKNLFLEQKVENFLILEESHERLKVSNEKLSRQLDETLVSMHHNEGENTEFEYLRNILFQYLSGHVNANGTTLVKVIAAVLKFTAAQTELVLEKESQRHTVLGSINNLL